MIGYGKGKGKIILKFLPFFRLNEEYQEQENSKFKVMLHFAATEMCLFVFLFSFQYPTLKVPDSKFKKAVISK